MLGDFRSIFGGIFISIWLISSLHAQAPTPLGIGRYAPLERIHINPALGAQSPYLWDATLSGIHGYGFTDYASVRTSSLLNLRSSLRNALPIYAIQDIPSTNSVPLIIFDRDRGDKSAYLRLNVSGPSFTSELRSGLRVGLFTKIRAHIASPKIPEGLGLYELNEAFETNSINIDPAVLSGASWMEIGAHLSKNIGDYHFGVHLKYLLPNEGFFAESETDADYNFIDSTVVVVGTPRFAFGLTNTSINAKSYQSSINGSGLGFDLGVSYRKEHIAWGVSIMDIGVLQFEKNLEVYTSEILQDITTLDTRDYGDFSSIREMIDYFQDSQNLTPDVFGKMPIGLPTRISIFYDHRFTTKAGVSVIWNHRIPIFPNALHASNSLVVTPRIETDTYGVFVPITISEYRSLRMGLAGRIGPLTIGTDHLMSVLSDANFRGSDIYLHLSIYPFGKSGAARKARKGEVFCPTF